MMKKKVTGEPIDDTVKYADVSDIERYLRSFDIGTNTDPSTDDVKKIIEQKTRKFERDTPVAFRSLSVTDLELDINPTYDQEYDFIGDRSRRVRPPRVAQGDRQHVRINLPNRNISNLSKVETITDYSDGYDAVSSDNYILNKGDGVLRIDISEFRKTVTGTSYNNVLSDARVRVDYEYGDTYLEPEVTECVAKLTVYDIVNSDAFGITLSESDFFVDPNEYTDRIKQEADEIITKYKHGRY